MRHWPRECALWQRGGGGGVEDLACLGGRRLGEQQFLA
jgi:hypothetical protein